LKKQFLLNLGIADQLSQLVVQIEVDVRGKYDDNHSFDGGVDTLNVNEEPVVCDLDGKKSQEYE